MTDLIVRENNLSATIEDLSKFVLFGDEALQTLRAEIRAMKKLHVAQEVVALQLSKAQDAAENVTLAKMKLGELLSEIPKTTNNNPIGNNQHRGQIDKPVDSTSKQKSKSETVAELGITQKQAERFQQMAKNPDVVHAAMAKARENDDVISQAQILNEIQQTKKPHVSFNGGNNEWHTPSDIIEAARKVFTITLDPASSAVANENVKAETFYTIDDDGLTKDWDGNNIWLNPPYSSGLIEKFVDN